MIPKQVHKVGQSTWLDVREHPSNLFVLTCENESVRPTLLPYEQRITNTTEILRILDRIPHVIILSSHETELPESIQNHPNSIIRKYSKERLSRMIPRNVYVWIQWFPHRDPTRAEEFNTAFRKNVECEGVNMVVQLNEESYNTDQYPFLDHPKIHTIEDQERVSYNQFFKLARSFQSEPNDFHVLLNADMEWTHEASMGLEYVLWEKQTYAICPLRWEDRKTLFNVRADSQDAWGFVHNALPDPSRMKREIPLGKPGCDNRILMELLVQGFQTLNHPLQFPTIHHHTTQIRDYTSKDKIPQPYLLVRPQWYFPLYQRSEDTWLINASLNLRNRVYPLLSDTRTNELITHAIETQSGFSIGKIGQIEAEAVNMYHQISLQERQALGQRQGMYSDRVSSHILTNAGVFPNDKQGIEAFCRLYQYAMSSCDILSVSYPWLIPAWGEHIGLCRGSRQNQLSCRISATEPFFVHNPYTRSLAGKRVLVVSPFIESFKKQIANRKNVWGDLVNDFLPESTQWSFVRTPLSAGIVPPIDEDWPSMIERLISECFPHEQEDQWPDIVLAGCGPGGLCITQAAKERGKVGISMGGGLQILFGVRGNRWDQNPTFQKFFNEHWIRPSGEECPPENVKVEQGCYW